MCWGQPFVLIVGYLKARSILLAIFKQSEKSKKITTLLGCAKLYFKITQHLTVIVYEVANDLDAGVIFETMNDRGRPLTELEKVKNYLLYVCSKLDLPTLTLLMNVSMPPGRTFLRN